MLTIVTVVVAKHKRPNLSDAANHRREVERRRASDASSLMTDMGHAVHVGYAQVETTDEHETRSLFRSPSPPPPPPSPPQLLKAPIIKVYTPSQRTLTVSSRHSMESRTSESDIEVYHRSEDDEHKSILASGAPPAQSPLEHDKP